MDYEDYYFAGFDAVYACINLPTSRMNLVGVTDASTLKMEAVRNVQLILYYTVLLKPVLYVPSISSRYPSPGY